MSAFGRDTPRRRWWLKSPAHQEEHGAAVKPLRRECRSDFGVPVLACVRLFVLHAWQWVRRAPGIPCALCFRGPPICKARTRNRAAGMLLHVFSAVVVRPYAQLRSRTERPSIPETAVLDPIGLWNTGSPAQSAQLRTGRA